MKATLKRVLRAVWRRLAVFRRPILRKYDDHLRALLVPLIEASVRSPISSAIEERVCAPLLEVSRGAAHNLERIEVCCDVSTHAAHETDLVLNSLVREVVRLQMQVEFLQQLVSSPDPKWSGDFRLGDRVGPPDPLDRSATVAERVLAG
jgi:hypothetical protein